MPELADTIVEEAVKTEQKKASGSPETIETFTKNVEKEAKRNVEAIEQATNVDVNDLMGEVIEESEGYAATKKRILDADFKVGATAERGAAAWNDKGKGNEIVVDDKALDYEDKKDEGYWERVGEHEKVHRDEQATSFNASTLTYIEKSGQEKTVEVIGDLTEGHATQVNTQADLSAEYAQFQAGWQEMTAAVSEEQLRAAMKSGDIQSLQEEIDKEAGLQMAA